MIKVINILLVLIFFLGLVSANGLQVSPTSMNITKTNGINYIFSLNITNEEPFPFYNITSQNPILDISKFSLQAGEWKSIQATITENSDFNGTIKLVGDYFTNLGASNETYNVEIDSEGVDICGLDLIEGDTIIWENTLIGEVKLKNMNTGEYFQTIQGGQTYTSLFDSPQEFDYQVFKTGLPFSNVCHINIRPESGYIHSSEYDALLNLHMEVEFEPTTVSTNFFTDEYTLSYNSEKEDSFRITNTGNKIAKNIRLSGDWFEFSDNNFDIPVGDYKTITYTVKPLIFETDQTNKTYNKTITIQGNFNTLEKTFDIFINYKNLDGIIGDESYDKDVLKDMVNFFCSIYPDDCPTTIVYGNESDQNVTFTINADAYREKILSDDKNFETILQAIGNLTEKTLDLEDKTNLAISSSNSTMEEVQKVKESSEGLLGTVILSISIFLFLCTTGIISYLYFRKKGSISVDKILSKGEVL